MLSSGARSIVAREPASVSAVVREVFTLSPVVVICCRLFNRRLAALQSGTALKAGSSHPGPDPRDVLIAKLALLAHVSEFKRQIDANKIVRGAASATSAFRQQTIHYTLPGRSAGRAAGLTDVHLIRICCSVIGVIGGGQLVVGVIPEGPVRISFRTRTRAPTMRSRCAGSGRCCAR